MSEGPSDDLARLFTPPGTPLSSALSDLPSTPNASPMPSKARQTETFFIEPPVLGSAEKSQYKTLPAQFVASGVEFDAQDIDQVIGEYREGTDLYYFARFQDGIAHKFHAEWFRSQYLELIKDYERKKEAGTLAPFDPSGHNVHPRSRIRHTIIINPKRAFAKNPALKSVAQNNVKNAIMIYDSEHEEDDEDGSDGDGDYGPRPPRSSRAAKKPVKDLPFSPRKQRARKGFVVPDSEEEDKDDDDDDDESDNEFVPTRRSSRSTKNAKAKYTEADDYVDDENEDEESEDDDHKPRKLLKGKAQKPKTKRIVRGKASRPVYGNVRHVVDLDYDVLSDEETAPLRAHRVVCEKCHKGPAHNLIEAASKKSKGRGRKKKDEDLDDFEGDEMERLTALGGWVRCLKCPVTAHWGCLASTQRHEILKAAQDRDRELLESAQAERRALAAGPDGDNEEGASTRIEVEKRLGLTPNQTTEFVCGSCMKGGICMGCLAVALQPDTSAETKKDVPPGASVNLDGGLEMADSPENAQKKQTDESTKELTSQEILFRCFTCKRLSHYAHLPVPPEYSEEETSVDSVMLAEYYQSNTEWHCSDCFSYKWELDKILAWRPYPSTAVEPPRPHNEPPPYKSALPREYLVKWLSRSYRRTQWVPHMWLVTTHAAKLKNFLNVGAKVELLDNALPDEDAMAVDDEAEKIVDEGSTASIPFEINADADQDSAKGSSKSLALPLGAMPDAERRIPLAWKTIDRVLDVLLWRPTKRKDSQLKTKAQGKRKGKKMVPSSEDEDDEDENSNDALDGPIKAELESAFAEGEQPSYDLTETVREWETRTGRGITTEQVKNVVWVFIKWDDLPYDEATWDSPPRKGKFGYSAFEAAFKRFVDSRRVHVMKLTKDEIKALDKRPKDEYKRKYALNRQEGEQPVLGQSKQLSLMPFQIDGVNWLCDNWWRLQHCILADEMGLGKTVQIVTFLGTIIGRWQGFPALVVVPNSTITNWVREFERWAPNLRVVPFYGEMKSREIIKQFELEHEVKKPGTTGAKFHVLVTTYESLNNPKDFTPVFKSIPRWEVLIVDEGQRLKSDSSLLFRKLNELRSIHRIIMTGTPLNNNMRELFNLMNFLDPVEWHDLEALEKEHEVLTDDLIKQLHERLRPYFLRRIKSEVLQLPPKNEVIVPVSMAPLQKEVYRSVLSKNLDILKSLVQPTKAKVNTTIGKLNNMLMQLRKCLQHPYLINDDIEPRGLSVQETQYKLIDGSAKLRFLKTLLPQLKARGHRVLLFSQFVIALDIVEDFLHGEGFKYLRLDGNTKQADRQKGMDTFNTPQSDVFIYLLTTRAGGVGINLWSADTVIIFDPDFNPHQDLQAIARAHRYGQKKTVLVFKLMVKDSAEERIMQTGKKKLVLDHLIVQKMDDEDSAGDDVQSILTFGAKALFEEGDQGAHDIIYTDHDIEKLIERTEKEGDQEQPEKKEGLSFSFAKIWAADKDTLEELTDDTTQNNDQDASWAQTLARIAAQRDKVQAQEITGRGVRRRAAAAPQQLIDFDDTPVKGKKQSHKSKSTVSDESDAYAGSAFGVSDGEDTDDAAPLTAGELLGLTNEAHANNETPKRTNIKGTVPKNIADTSSTDARYRDAAPLSPIHNTKRNGYEAGNPMCSLCGIRHGDDACYMTESSENLAEYRQMLILHADDEPIEDRQAAIRVIDEALYKRGKMHLIDGQPLHLLDKPSIPNPQPKKKSKRAHPASASAIQHSTSSGKAAASTFSVDLSPRLVASSSKRTSSPLPSEEPSSKKQKFQSSPSSCVVCNRSPFHLVKDCPTVLEGPKSISKAIRRLEDDPKHFSTVHILNKILKKQKRRELAQSSSDAVMVND